MRKATLAALIVISAATARAQTMGDVLRSVESNNMELKALQKGNEAADLETRSENTLEALSVEYSPFFDKGVKGVASSEMVVSQGFDFPTLYGARKKEGRLQREARDTEYMAARRDVLLEAKNVCLDLIHMNKQKAVLEERRLNADRLFRFVRAYAMSDARADAIRQEKVAAGLAVPRKSREDVGLINWNAILRYTRERWREFRTSGAVEGLGATRGEIISQVLGTAQRHNMANAYRWLKTVGLVEVDADCMKLESRALREAERVLGDGTPRWRVEDLADAKMLEGFFTVCRSQSFDLSGELVALDRDTPAGERRFWS